MNRLLLCPPDFYAVLYEINPWMDRGRGVNRAQARRQWDTLCRTLAALDCELDIIPAEPGWPDMVFTANAGLAQGRHVMLSNFRHPQRAGERAYFARWFLESGYGLTGLSPHLAFEGEGDALWLGGTLCCAHGFRTDAAAHPCISRWSNAPLLSLQLIDPYFYHLDTCLCPLGSASALWHPDAFDSPSRAALQSLVRELIEIPSEEASCLACNAIVLDHDVVLPEECPVTGELLRLHGFRPHPVAMSEFIKAGGACKCLVLHLR